MAYVSVGQIENFEEAIIELHTIYNTMEKNCLNQIKSAEVEFEKAQQEADNSTKLFESALEAEIKAGQKLEYTKEQLILAKMQLNSARSSLLLYEASGSIDVNGNYYPSNCLAEESNVSIAESTVIEADFAHIAAKEAFESTKNHRIQMEQRRELAHRCFDMTTQLMEKVKEECSKHLFSTSSYLEAGINRLENAKAALNSYLNTQPIYTEFYNWLKWSPSSKTLITPKELRSRLNLSVEKMQYYFEYLLDRDPEFQKKIEDYRRQLKSTNGTAERHAIQLKIRRNLSGYCSEKIVEQALSPLGNKIDTQVRTTFKDGRFTKTDLIVNNLKVPIILGRGEGMSAPIGGSIAIEVKCGQASYLYSQKDHMVFQSRGHQKANASITICSRDIKDLNSEKEKEVRTHLRNANSPIISMLPQKNEIDEAIWNFINLLNGETYEN